jgi:hypothetical protein
MPPTRSLIHQRSQWYDNFNYLPTYPPTVVPTLLHTNIPTHLSTHPPSYIPTYLSTHPPTYIPTYLKHNRSMKVAVQGPDYYGPTLVNSSLYLPIYLSIYLFMALQSLWTLDAFQFLNLYTVGRTPWTGDQPVARPLPTHRTQTENKGRQIYIHALSGIGTHDPSVRAGEDGSCLRPRGHCDRSVNC